MGEQRPWWKAEDPRLSKMKRWLDVLRIMTVLFALIFFGTLVLYPWRTMILLIAGAAALLAALLCHSFKLVVQYIIGKREDKACCKAVFCIAKRQRPVRLFVSLLGQNGNVF